MRLRLSDGYSCAQEFVVSGPTTFQREVARAFLKYAAVRGGRWRGRPDAQAELQVYVSPGNWASANFPRSNAPLFVRLGRPLPADLHAQCVRAADRAGYVEHALSGLAGFVSFQPQPTPEARRRDFRVYDGNTPEVPA